MSGKQRSCLMVGFVSVVISLLFVPTHPYRSPMVAYSFLFTGQGSIDFSRLLVEWLLIVLVVGASFLALSKSKTSATENRHELGTASSNKGRVLLSLTVTLGVLVLCLCILSYWEMKKRRRLEAGIQNAKAIIQESVGPFDLVRIVLDPIDIPTGTKHQLWDDYYGAKDQADFVQRFEKLDVSPELKAQLWHLRFELAPACDARQSQLQSKLERINQEFDGPK